MLDCQVENGASSTSTGNGHSVGHGADSPGRRPMMYGDQGLKREGWHLVQSFAVCPMLNQEHSLQYALSQLPNSFHFSCLWELTLSDTLSLTAGGEGGDRG